MADELDLATDREEIARAAAVARRLPVGPIANGRCHHCDEIVDDEHRWCDADCRDAWQRDQKPRRS